VFDRNLAAPSSLKAAKFLAHRLPKRLAQTGKRGKMNDDIILSRKMARPARDSGFALLKNINCR